MENEWKKAITYRNIAQQAGALIVVLLVVCIMGLLGQLALDTLRVYAYWFGFAACIIILLIIYIFGELMKIAEQEWENSRIGEEE